MGAELQRLLVSTGGNCQAVSISTTSAQSAAISATRAIIYVTVDAYIRRGTNPTALNNGTDTFVPAMTFVPIEGWASGEKLAIITVSSTGTAYITPGA